MKLLPVRTHPCRVTMDDDALKPMSLPLELVLDVIRCMLPKPNVLLAPSHPITQTLLSFTLVCHETRRFANRCLLQHCIYLASESSLRSLVLTIPARPDLRNITALFLAPFADTIDNQPTAIWIRELFGYTGASLRRLIIDIPLRSLYPDDDHLGVRAILNEGFQRLENLEELVSVRDELYLDTTRPTTERPFWTRWPRLRRLAVYNADCHSSFWSDVATRSQLETLVLTRADGLDYCDPKAAYLRHCSRPLKILLINVEQHHVRFSGTRVLSWTTVDPDRKVNIVRYTVPLFNDDDPIEVCQDYVRIGAEHGTLWDWEGETIGQLPGSA